MVCRGEFIRLEASPMAAEAAPTGFGSRTKLALQPMQWYFLITIIPQQQGIPSLFS